MEFKKYARRVTGAIVLTAGLISLSGCSNPSGEGNDFHITGVVTDPGKESLKVRVSDVVATRGDANGWFKEGKVHQLHDNCDCHGAWNGRKQYGFVHDKDGSIVEPSAVAVNACVDIVGKIRDDQEGKTYNARPVYESAQIVDCATLAR